MTAEQLTRLKFPIGPFVAPPSITDAELAEMITTIEEAPAKYRALANTLSTADLTKTYREGAWNVQQLFNHVADMALLHFFRMKRVLTESDYKEITLVNIEGWTATADGATSPIEDSLIMFEGITRRFVFLMRSLTPEQYALTYYHPVRKTDLNQKQAIAMSAWHVKHHLEHIRIAIQK